ncbi:UNVERIFIED_CONTAM: hypothetical protein K2H54_059421 [Gekko kuhli]
MTSPLRPRECKLTRKDKESYGFCLRLEKHKTGHLIRNVIQGSPAEKAGLKDGDRVLRVNGVFVDKEDHGQVADLVRKNKNSVIFLVLDEKSYEKAQKEGTALEKLGQTSETQHLLEHPPPATNSEPAPIPQPRLCYLTKDGENSYGFSLKTTADLRLEVDHKNNFKIWNATFKSLGECPEDSKIGQKGLFIIDISPQGSAAKAGVQPNDHLIEVNGENVENDTHEEVVEKVRRSGNQVVFLLSDKETDWYYNRQNMPLKREMASLKFLPHKPRTIELKKGNNGYGFCLRMEQNYKGHLIKDIDSDSPAATAGLKENDVLVAVNGELVEKLDHNSVVDKIKESGEKTTLLVMDEETDAMYKMAQISPCHKTTVPSLSEAEVLTHRIEQQNHQPRICNLVKGPNGFGFHLNAVKDLPGQFIKQVQKGGPADLAGLKDDDILIEVNGVNVENEDYENVVARIREGSNRLTLLVCAEKTHQHIRSENLSAAATSMEALPHDYSSDPPPYTEVQEPQRLLSEAHETASSSSSLSVDSEEDTKL